MFAGLLLVATLMHHRVMTPALAPLISHVDTTRMFPRVEGTNLEGRKFVLPADFESPFNVVLIAFRREQQDDVDTWLPFLREQRVAERGIRVYELPVIGRGYGLMRGFINGGMARGIPEKATREVTITLFIDKSPFKQALAIANEERIVALITSRDGRVRWRADGRFTPALGAELGHALEMMTSARP